MDKCLILTSNKKFWPKKDKHYFLGNWCLENITGSFKEKSNFKIIKDLTKERDLDQNFNLTKKIYNNLILDISKELNKIQNRNFSTRFWEIIVGHWLREFIGFIVGKFYELENGLKNKNINKIILANYKNFNLNLVHTDDIANKNSYENDLYCFVIYTKIFEFLKRRNIKSTKIDIGFNNKKDLNPKEIDFSYESNLSFFSKKIISKFLSIFRKDSDPFIYGVKLKSFDLIQLYLKLKLVPQINIMPFYSRVETNKKIRNKLSFKKQKVHKIEDFIRKILVEVIPSDYIENFKRLDKITDQINLQKNPKFILTGHGYRNIIFSYWTAKKVEKRVPYYLMQHGGNYFSFKHNHAIEPGYSTCSKFLSWGKINYRKTFPLFNTNNIPYKSLLRFNSNKIFVYSTLMNGKRNKSYNNYEKMILEHKIMSSALNGLSDNNKKDVIIRLHSTDRDFLRNKILNEIFFNKMEFMLDKSMLTQKKVYKKSKLIIHGDDGTGILETLSLNIPSIFLMSDLKLITKNCKKDYLKLKDAKILFFNSKELSNHVNKYSGNINKWWFNKKVVNIRNNFVNKYSRPVPKNPISDLVKLLNIVQK